MVDAQRPQGCSFEKSALARRLMPSCHPAAFALAGYALLPAPPGVVPVPDWLFGILFGLGGFIGDNQSAPDSPWQHPPRPCNWIGGQGTSP